MDSIQSDGSTLFPEAISGCVFFAHHLLTISDIPQTANYYMAGTLFHSVIISVAVGISTHIIKLAFDGCISLIKKYIK